MSLDRNLLRSLAWSKSQREVANLISGSYTVEVVEKWHKMRNDFDGDSSKPNPYEEVEKRTSGFLLCLGVPSLTSFVDCTMAQLRLELLKEELKQTSGTGDTRPHKVSAGAFFRKAIEIEDRV